MLEGLKGSEANGCNLGQITFRCPVCRDNGKFLPVNGGADLKIGNTRVGFRRCPEDTCGALVLFRAEGGRIQYSPMPLFDFEATNLPPELIATLREAAMASVYGLFRASAMLTRRALEQLCSDRGCRTKNNLKTSVEALCGQVAMPAGMKDALLQVRLLGNDATHVESTEYDDIGQEECEAAFEIIKMLLQLIYQSETILGKLATLGGSAAGSEQGGGG